MTSNLDTPRRTTWDLRWLGCEVVPPSIPGRRNDLQSKITVKNRSDIIGEFGVPIGCLRARKTEIEALRSHDAPRLDALHQRVLYLEQVAAQPGVHPEYHGRPTRAIYGTARWQWISGQCGIHPSRVATMLDWASTVLAYRLN